MKTTTFTISELQKLIQKCKVHREREVRRGEKILLNEYVSTKELLRRLNTFGELKEKVLSELD